MFSACINAKSGESLAADGGVGNHALDSLGHYEFGLFLHKGAVFDLLHVTDVTGVMIIHFLVKLLSGKNGLVGVDDDYMVAAIRMGCKGGLMLSAEKLGSLGGNVTEMLALGVDNIPLTGDVAGFRHIG